jgi:hypothetical protein
MHAIIAVLGLFFISAVALLYVALNVYFAPTIFSLLGKTLRLGIRWLRLAVPHVEQFFHVQLKYVSTARMYWTVGIQFGATFLMFYVLSMPHSLFTIGTVLLSYVFGISAVTLSLLSLMPYFRSLWEDAATKFGLLIVPAYVGYVSKGYASEWIGRMLETSASNTPMALIAATVFVLCLAMAIALAITALVFEFTYIFGIVAASGRTIPRKAAVTMVLVSSFVATVIAAYTSLQPTKTVGAVLISAIAFDFDAGPATECSLNPDEEFLARTKPDPIIKALHLSSSQERARLVKRPPSLFREITYRKTGKEDLDAKMLMLLRPVDCHKDPKAPDAAASQAASANAR